MRRARTVAMVLVLLTACSRPHQRSATSTTAAPPSTTRTAAAPPTPSPPTTAPAAPGPAATAPPPPPGCPPVPARNPPAPDRPRYSLTVAVDAASRTASGTEEVRFSPDRPTDRLVLRLWPNGSVPAARGGHLEAGPITVDGSPRSTSQPDPTTLVVPMTVAGGQSVTLSMPWRLAIPANLSERWSVSGGAVRLGTFVPVLAWEPGVGWATEAPTVVHGEAATTPVADWDVRVDAHGLDVLATGTSDGRGRWTATAVRDFALSAGRFTLATRQVGEVAVTVGVDAGVGEAPARYLDKVADALGSFSRRFGPYPYPAYTLAVTPGLTGGIESPMLTMQGPGTIGRSTSHELGHQWFYALVGNDQARDPWLDEGLATWAEAGYEHSLASFVRRAMPPDAAGKAGRPVAYWDGHAGSYYRGVYVQPTQALARLGPPERVDCVLAVYVARFANRIARPADLIGVLSATFADAPAVLAGYGLTPS